MVRIETLPPGLRSISPSATPLTSAPLLAESPGTLEGRTWQYLRNRRYQLLMLLYRPFLSAVVQNPSELERLLQSDTPKSDIILRGVSRCIVFSLTFLQAQAGEPHRHYGSWLLARNIWSATLTMIAAVSTPVLCHALDNLRDSYGAVATSTWGQSHPLVAADLPGDAFDLASVLTVCKCAITSLEYWRFESPSLSEAACLLYLIMVRLQAKLNN